MSETAMHNGDEIPVITHAPDILQLDSLDQVVGTKQKLRRNYTEHADGHPDSMSFRSFYDHYLNDQLEAYGVKDSPDDAAAHEEYEQIKATYDEVASMDQIDWLTSEDGTGLRRRNVVFQDLLERYGAAGEQSPTDVDADADDTEPTPLDVPESDEPQEPPTPDDPANDQETKVLYVSENKNLLDSEFGATRQKYAELLAKRSKKMGLIESSTSREAIAHNREELQALINAMATELMLELESQGRTKAEIAAEIDTFIAGAIDGTIQDMENYRVDEYENRHSLTKKFLDKWASWGDINAKKQAFFSKGRFKKTLVFALPSAGIGLAFAAATAPFVAGAGTAVAVGAGAVWTGRTIARRLAGAKLDSAANARTVAAEQSADIMAQMQTAGADAIHDDLFDVMEERTDFYRRRNRNRLLAGTAIALTAGILSSQVGHVVADYLGNHNVGSWLADKARSPWGNGNNGTPASVPPTTTPGTPPNYPDYGHPGNGDTTANGHSNDSGDSSPKWRYDSDDRHIESGEGWYQTMREMGIGSSHRAELLDDVGPKLHDEGLAYWDKSAHEWRMNMTDDGTLPKSAIRMIAESAHEHGWHTNYDQYLDGASGTDSATAVSSGDRPPDFSDAARRIDTGEGFYQTIHEMGVASDAQSEVLDKAAPELLKLDGVAYEMADGNPGILMNADHELSDDAMNVLHDAAVETGANDDASVMHDGVVFDGVSENGSGDTVPMNEFVIDDAVRHYDADANAYYDVLKGTDKAHWKTILNESAPQLQKLTDGGLSLTYKDSDGWHFREVSKLSVSARSILKNTAERHDWTLAA